MTLGVLREPLEGYMRGVMDIVLDLAQKGKGGRPLGTVPGRLKTEDEEIEVDRACDDLLYKWCQETGLSITIYSEHGTRNMGQNPGNPSYVIATDPFDGSGLFRRGIAAEWWSVLSVYDGKTLEPLGGLAADILRNELYIAEQPGVIMLSKEDERGKRISPKPKKAMDDNTVIATYLMDPSYLSRWLIGAAGLLEGLTRENPAARLWPNGGSSIYPWLSRGLVHAYVAFEEPRSEIDPGLAFAWASGYPLLSMDPYGNLEPYRFVRGMQTERVSLLIAACTQELAQEIVMRVRGN